MSYDREIYSATADLSPLAGRRSALTAVVSDVPDFFREALEEQGIVAVQELEIIEHNAGYQSDEEAEKFAVELRDIVRAAFAMDGDMAMFAIGEPMIVRRGGIVEFPSSNADYWRELLGVQ